MPIEGGHGLPGDAGRDPRWPAPTLPAVIELDGRRLRLRASPAAPLLRALARRNWMAFLPGLLGARDSRWISGRLDDPGDPLDLVELAAAAQWSAALVCRMPWWAAVRLASTAHEGWPWIDGRAALSGVDLLEMPVDRALAAVWAFLRDRRDTEEGVDSLTETVYGSGMQQLELAQRIAPRSLDALEAQWAAEAAASFAGMDGVWDPTAGA